MGGLEGGWRAAAEGGTVGKAFERVCEPEGERVGAATKTAGLRSG